MTPEEKEMIQRLVTGYWPHPEMTDDEIRVWTITLEDILDVNLAAQVIRNAAASGRDFRINAGQFIAEYRAARMRKPPASIDKEQTPELETTTERKSVNEWRSTVRAQIEELKAKGSPLAGAFRQTTHRIVTRYATDSPESRALALTRVSDEYREMSANAAHKAEPKDAKGAPKQEDPAPEDWVRDEPEQEEMFS